MSNQKACGSCNYQGDSKHTGKKEVVLCLFHNAWNDSNYVCEDWSMHSYHLSDSDRLRIAKDAKQSKESSKQEVLSNIKSSKDRRFQIILVLISFILGISATLLTQWLSGIFF